MQHAYFMQHASNNSDTPTTAVLRVSVGDRTLGVRVSDVAEVVRMVAITPLPNAPGAVCGVVNVRGTIAPVVDLGLRLGDDARPIHPNDRLLITTTRGRLVALRVDRAHDLIDVDDRDFEDVTRVTSADPRIRGIVTAGDDLLLVVDIDALLSEAEALQLDALLRDEAEI